MGSPEQTEPLFYYLSTKAAVLCLSFIGGFVDATGYVKLYGLFTSSITGNLVVGCSALFGHSVGLFARLYVTFFFAIGAFAITIAAAKMRVVQKRTQWDMGMVLFKYEIWCIVLALIFGVSVDYAPGGIPSIDSWQALFVGSLLALSMGVHNAAAQDLIANCPSTTVMTMTIVKVSIFLGNAVQYWFAMKRFIVLHPPNEKPDDYEESIKKKHETNLVKFLENVQPLLFFVLGAMFGALLSIHMTFWCLIMPLLVLSGLVYSIQLAQKAFDPTLHRPVADIEMECATSPMAEDAQPVVAEELPHDVSVEVAFIDKSGN
jgi:uncharacterized membrane protein YoaK (UPF0700 family)